MMLRCVAIDDEPIALSILREYAARCGGIDLSCFTSPTAGMGSVLANPPDILFLDIELRSCNGLELAQQVPRSTCLILTTAYSRYALDGYNLDAVDFLHKPIFYGRFLKAIDKARLILAARNSLIAAPPEMPHDVQGLTLRVEHRTVVVRLSNILLIEAMDNYVKVYRRGLRMLMSHITMKELVAQLPESHFVRVHRSYIVPVGAITSYTNHHVRIDGLPQAVPIGRTYLQNFLARLS